ncbi:MerR family transcriptional regulator [Candidatus Eisenbacteria bacterium]|uniref:MerR family transcriptional regulator n=1 Tax=Eiseniibacteriota bacterium TaxID=2212470 RepID=A0ABV6YN93_UNCEI
MRKKTPTKLYYSITEVAELTNVKPHVLRYWETEFKALRPKKNRAGNRTYRAGDIKLIRDIKRLLYDDGFTIAGAKKKLLQGKPGSEGRSKKDKRGNPLEAIRKDLLEMQKILEA